MNNHRIIWLILGIVMFFAGILVLDQSSLAGILLFIGGFAVLILLSIDVMRVSGSVKGNYFHRGGDASERFTPNPSTEPNQNVWQQMTQKQEEV